MDNPLLIAVKFFTYPLGVFLSMLLRSNMLAFYNAMFTLAAVYRLLIVPLIGQALNDRGSDTVRSRDKNKRNKV